MSKDGDTRRALIVIDVQRDFVEKDGGLAVPDGRAVIPVINSLRRGKRFDLVIFALDFHPSSHWSFWTNHPGHEPFSQIGPQTLWTEHCLQESRGAAVHEEVDVLPSDVRVLSGLNPSCDSYSACRDNDKKTVSPLLDILRA